MAASNTTTDGNATDGGLVAGGREDLSPFGSETEEYIFHQTQVKVPLLLLYTLVFILAFFGKYPFKPWSSAFLVGFPSGLGPPGLLR